MKNVACLLSDRSRGENAAYLVPETLKGKNVACLLSDRSRALAQAYVLKRQDDILYWKTQNKLMQHSSFDVKETTKLWLPSKVTLYTRSIHAEPGFIGSRRISEIRTIPSSQLLAVYKHLIRRCKFSGIKIIIYINCF